MTNDLKNFLDGQVRKFCSEADDSMFPVELDKSYTEVVNFVLDLVGKELHSKPTAYLLAVDVDEAYIRSKDVDESINKLRV